MVENDSSPHLKMFDEVSKRLTAEMSVILISEPKYIMGLSYYPYSNMSVFVILLIINFPVSYNIDKTYKVILGLFLEVLGQKRHSIE